MAANSIQTDLEVNAVKPKSIEEVENIGPVSFDDAEEKALVRKIDWYLLPTIWVMYLFSYMDRTNVGNARIAGMDDDLELTSDQFSLVLIIFFIGYVVLQVPSNIILTKTRPSIYVPILMFLWGIVTGCTGLVQNFEQLLGLRLVVGLLEAGFAPAVLLILASWYKKDEMSKRYAVYISAAVLSGAFGGLIAGGITGTLEGANGIRGWRWLFIVEGAATCALAIVSSFILLDFPESTKKKLNAREREVAMARLLAQDETFRTEDTPVLTTTQATIAALKHWKTWALTFGYMVVVGSLSLSYFYPTLVAGLGYDAHTAQYMTVPIYAVAFVAVAICGYVLDMFPGWRGVAIAANITVGLISGIVICTSYNLTVRYVFMVFLATGLWAANGLALSYAGAIFAPEQQEVRAVALAFINAMGNLSQIYGAYLFPSRDAPLYLMGFGVITGMCGFGVGVYLFIHFMIRKGH